MEISTIKAAARKALMAADQNYYSWPAEHQERFRATMDAAATSRVDSVLLKDLLGIQRMAENAREIWRDLPLSKLNNLNWAKLLTTGIGQDYIFINESLPDNKSLLDFATLFEYDHDDHLFQEQTNKKEFKGYECRDYYALRFARWVRLIIDEQFHYATLYSLAGYLIDKAEEKSNDTIQTLIPHKYVEGKEHGKKEKGGFRWDMQVDAAGLENQLDELNSRWHRYTQQRWLELSKKFKHLAPEVFVEEKNQDGELNRNFIFTNENALKKIRWRHFLADCRTLVADSARLAEMAEHDLARAETWLQEMFEDIMKDVDSNVVKLKKRRKVIVAPGAFVGLVDGDGDE
jgi:hypothetical protein